MVSLLLILPSSAGAVSPASIADRAGGLIDRSVDAWQARQDASGGLLDPVRGSLASYGKPMLAQAMIERGVARGDRSLIDAGLRAERAQIANPDNGGFNVGFEVLGLVDAVRRNDALLTGDPEWQALRPALVEFIKLRYRLGVRDAKGRSAAIARCLADAKCFYNLKLVGAVASIDFHGLFGAPVSRRARQSFKIANPKGSTTSVAGADDALIAQAARLTSRDARQSGWRRTALGLLSDPAGAHSNNPLAYNALCAMLLGRAIEIRGIENSPANVRSAFFRTARSIVGYISPAGAISYVGRGQGQVWVEAAALDALSLAARHTVDPLWRGRFLTAAERIVSRLETAFAPSAALGLALVPRLAGIAPESVNYRGLDGYAIYTMYEGLALYCLQNAREALTGQADVSARALGADHRGTFLEPSQTKFATVRTGDRWYAVHGGDALADARYDFGIVAAERRLGTTWISALPNRPLTTHRASAAGAIKLHGRTLLPTAERIGVRRGGVVVLRGGWTAESGGRARVDRGTKWTFSPVTGGVKMRFRALKTRRYEFTVWYRHGATLNASSNRISITEPGGQVQSYGFNRPVSMIQNSGTDASAYDLELHGLRLVVRAKRGSSVVLTTRF